ncbi:MAG: replication restart helicase PriA [Prevotella sp.]|jgi:primosomal protein N' (replication factor Y)
MKYVDVILPLPLEGTFTYAVSDNLAAKIVMGIRVLVPLGKSKVYTAMCAGTPHDSVNGLAQDKVKFIIAVLDSAPMLLSQQMRLWQWISKYYMAPLGDIFKAALPSGLKREEGYRPKMEVCVGLAEQFRNSRALHTAFDMISRAVQQQKVLACFLALTNWDSLDGDKPKTAITEITREELTNESHCTTAIVKALCERKILYTYEREVGRLNQGGSYHPELIKPLSEPQQDAYNGLLLQMMKKNVVLLHGVTSSGKTELYIHLIEKTLSEHKQVLYLLPEIALTVQITSRLQRVFGNRLGIYHSKYSDAERVEIWRKQLSANPYDVILGARSAVFLPYQNLGLVIIDEEHETSFKQQDPSPRYHARSAAIVMAQMYGAKTVLGTATPSMESYYNARTGKYGLVELKTRYQGIELPEIRVVNIKDLRRRKMMSGPFSPTLLAAMREALSNGKQVILFQNRRGFAPMIECRICGWVPKCKNCDVSLTYHKRLNLLTCHYCGFTYTVPSSCPNCGNPNISGRGYGTEKIEDLLSDIFPEARVARMDLDTTRTRNAYERLIGDFSRGKTNVLVGTQMISKGLDFENVAVVGILDADSMLNYPDFRAYEHAFMMMSQVSGRAGRKGKRGLVILQTKSPELPVVQQVVGNDFQGFYNDLLQERETFHYPPFYHLVYVFLKHRQEAVVEMAAQEMGAKLRQLFGERVLGPDKPSVARVKAMCIRKIVVKLENGVNQRSVRSHLRQVQQQMTQQAYYKALQIYYDVDPI